MPTALITGGLGYVGSFITDHYHRQGWHVRVTGRTEPARLPDGVSFYQRKLDPDTDWRDVLDGVQHVIHGAFQHVPGKYRSGEGDDPDGFWRANVDGSRRLMEQAAQHTEHFVFLSSRAAYADAPPGVPLLEDNAHAGTPASLYGKAKRAIEKELLAAASPTYRGHALRITGVYGTSPLSEYDKWYELVDQYLRGEPIASRAGTEVHGTDVATAIDIAIGHNISLANVSDILVDRADMLSIVKEATKARHALPARAGSTSLNQMDTERLRTAGWRPGGQQRLSHSVARLAATLVKRQQP